jgi:hypothetical protein
MLIPGVENGHSGHQSFAGFDSAKIAQTGEISDLFYFFTLYCSVLRGITRYCRQYCAHRIVAALGFPECSLRFVGHQHRPHPI